MTSAEEYAHWVLSEGNEKKTGRLIKLACQRFLNDLNRDDIYFDEYEANWLINFCQNHLCQWEGEWEGQPVKLELWQKFHLQQLFGWIRKDTGTRRFTKFFLEVAKKNGKSSECAWLSVGHLFADERVKTPKVFTAANNEDQAKICVNMAGQTVKYSPDLAEMIDDEVRVLSHSGNIIGVIHEERNGFIKALSKEGGDKKAKTSGGKHGINASLGLVDEFGMSPDHGASGSIATSMASRKERLMAYLTTAGFNMDGPCYRELREQGIKCLEGIENHDSYLPIIYELDKPIGEDGKPQAITLKYLKENEEVWYQCNPNLDVSVQRDYLREMLNDAISLGGTMEVEVKTLNFNMWCETPEVWIPADVWNRNSHGTKLESLAAGQCFAGLEIVSGLSLNCLALFFPNVGVDLHAVRCLFWMPSAAIQDKNASLDFQRWSDEGLIELCPGNVIDNDFVWEKVRSLFAQYNVDSLAFNKILTNHDILQALVRAGIKVNPISQGYSGISTPTKEWESLLTAGQIEHFGNPVLSWMNANTMVNRNKDQEIRVEKSKDRTAGITACINALAQYKIWQAENMDDGKIESW